jgi:hypothetical protein
MRVGRATAAAIATLTLAGCEMGVGQTPSRIPLQSTTELTSATSMSSSMPDSRTTAVSTTTASVSRPAATPTHPAAAPTHPAATTTRKAVKSTTTTSRPAATPTHPAAIPTHKVITITTSTSARAGVVHPGAFCHEGDRGVTARGTPMTCSEGRWRASTKTTTASRPTTTPTRKAVRTTAPAPIQKAGDEDAKSDTTASTAPTRHASATRAAATREMADSTFQHSQTDDGGQHGSF